MFSPRRLLLMIFSFMVCFGAYQLYAYFLGHYDGLAPLPPEYRYNPNAVASSGAASEERYKEQKHEMAKLLELAFGPKCPELNRARTIEIGKPESRTIMAFDDYAFVEGKLRMTKVSVANYKLLPAEGKLPERYEIVAIQGEVAMVTFNQPIKNLFDLKQGTKPVSGFIEADEVKITHNHGTLELNDDVTVYCKKRIEFNDTEKRIWSDHKVQVLYAFPTEARFEGTGLEISLASELVNKPDEKNHLKLKNPQPSQSSMGMSTVKKITLTRDVEFTFHKLSGSFLGGTVGKPDDKKPEASALPAQPMIVRCKDQFSYDVQSHVAVFNTRVNALRHRTVTENGKSRELFDELDADERLTLELMPPGKPAASKPRQPAAPEPPVQQFQLKKAVATGKRVKVIANDDRQGSGLQAEGIELICDNVAHEAKLRGKEEVIAKLSEYDIVARGVITILLPKTDAADKEPRGMLINGPGEIKLRASAKNPDPYTVASWQKELQWHRTTEEHRVELRGSAVLMHEKQGQMSGETVKAWLLPGDGKKAGKPTSDTASLDKLDGRLKRVEVDGRVSVLSAKLMVRQASKLTLNFTEAAPGTLMTNTGETGFLQSPVAAKNDGASGKSPIKPATPPVPAQPIYLQASELDGDILVIGDKQILRRLEARENVHIERKSEPGKQNALDIRGQRLEMSMQGNTELYRVKLFGNRASLSMEKVGLEGQQIDLDQTENRVTIPGPGTFRFYTDQDFQGRKLPTPELVKFVWDERMEFGGRAAQFVGSVIAENGNPDKGNITLSCYSMTITLDKTISLSGKDEQPNQQTVSLESVICISNPQTNGGRVIPVVVEQRYSPKTPARQIIRIEGVQVVFDNSRKEHEILKVYGPGEVNMVRAGKNQMFDMGIQRGPAATMPVPTGPTTMKLTRVNFEQEMEYKKNEGVLRFWKNIKTFYVPGEDLSMSLDEKRLPKEGIYLACEKMVIATIIASDKVTSYHEMNASGNTEMRGNQTAYVKADELNFNEEKGIAIMTGKNNNDALFYNQERPGAPYSIQRAKSFRYDLKTGEFRGENVKSIQMK